VNTGDIINLLLLTVTLGVLLVAPTCYICISGYREGKAEAFTMAIRRREEAQIQVTLLEHKVWPGRPIDWYGHDNCHVCGIYANPPRPTLPDPMRRG
jgi:hypothetical protein